MNGETIYFRKADVFAGERPIDTLQPLMTVEALQELADRAATIDAAYGKPTSDSKPSAR